MTIEEIIKEHRIEMESCRPVYECRITALDVADRSGIPEEFGMTLVHEGKREPTLAEVLTQLALLAMQHESTKLPRSEDDNKRGAKKDVRSFKHWCLRYGHDPLSPAAKAQYLKIRRTAEQLKYVVGDEAYYKLLEAVK